MLAEAVDACFYAGATDRVLTAASAVLRRDRGGAARLPAGMDSGTDFLRRALVLSESGDFAGDLRALA